MCKQGIKIGRRTATRTVKVTPTSTAGVIALKRREDRIAITAVINANIAIPPGFPGYGLLKSVPQANEGVFAAVNLYSPAWHGTVEELGELITGEVYVGHLGSLIPDIWVTEVYLNVDLEEAAS